VFNATIELERATWADYFERFMAEGAVEQVAIEIETPELGHQVEAAGLVLETLLYDPRDDVFEIAAAHPVPNGHEGLRHLIGHPVAIQVDGPMGILPTVIAIDDGDGVRTTVRLTRSAAISG
jgi:hypothetical protein